VLRRVHARCFQIQANRHGWFQVQQQVHTEPVSTGLINRHFVWHTKDNAPVLEGSIEKPLHDFLKERALQTPGVYFHQIGGIPDHVHLVVSVPPTLLISDWIGQMKGSSSHYINHRIANRHLLADGLWCGQLWNGGSSLGPQLCPKPAATSREGNDSRAVGARRG
jgi:REP element-mobilizing transposase RayT